LKNSLSPTLKFLLGAACLVIVLVGLQRAAPMFNQLALALIIAVTAAPLMRWLRGKGMPNGLALAITVLVILLILVVFVGFLVMSVSSLGKAIPTYAAQMENLGASLEGSLSSLGLDLSGAGQALFGIADISQLLEVILGALVGIVDVFASFVITFLVIVFLLVDSLGLPEKMAEFMDGGDNWLSRAGNFGHMITKYIIITGAIGAVIGLINSILLLILGVDFPVLWGVLAFLLNFVPIIGYWLALIPPMVIGTLESGLVTGLAVFLGYWIINGSAENIVKPKIMGEGLNLSPATVFISVFFWSAVLGPFGALLGVPMTMAVKELILEADPDTVWIARLISSKGKAKEPGDFPEVEAL